MHKGVGHLREKARQKLVNLLSAAPIYILLRDSSPDVNRKRQLFPPTLNPREAGERVECWRYLAYLLQQVYVSTLCDELVLGVLGTGIRGTWQSKRGDVRQGSRPSFHESRVRNDQCRTFEQRLRGRNCKRVFACLSRERANTFEGKIRKVYAALKIRSIALSVAKIDDQFLIFFLYSFLFELHAKSNSFYVSF